MYIIMLVSDSYWKQGMHGTSRKYRPIKTLFYVLALSVKAKAWKFDANSNNVNNIKLTVIWNEY